MSYIPPSPLFSPVFGSPGLDAFSRMRVSNPNVVLSAIHDYDKRPDIYDEVITGGATSVFQPNRKSVAMTVNAPGDSVIRQTWRYLTYVTGNSQMYLMTFVGLATAVGLSWGIGAFDSSNGIFLRSNAAGVTIVRRSSVSGAPVDTAVPQASWNLDPMNGLGRSGINLDFTKSQILVIDYQWLGVGRVRIGFDVDGNIVYAHQFLNANNVASVYMTTGKLPVRYEITGSAGLAAPATLEHICAAVLREGEESGVPVARACSSGTGTISPGAAKTMVLGVRVSPSSLRDSVLVESLEAFITGNNPVLWELHLSPTYVGVPVWNSCGPNSASQFATGPFTVGADGTILAAGYAGANSTAARGLTTPRATSGIAGASIAGTPQEIWLVMTQLGGATTARAAFQLQEFRG